MPQLSEIFQVLNKFMISRFNILICIWKFQLSCQYVLVDLELVVLLV